MKRPSLESLPDEIVLDILGHLDAAGDVARLAATSRHANSLIHHSAWFEFVRLHFPTLRIPSNQLTDWSRVADRLTYIHRCWEKRAFFPTEFTTAARKNGRRQIGQTVAFPALLAAKPVPSLREDLVVCGAGEDLLFRWTPVQGGGPPKWKILSGKTANYGPGTGDVTALSLIDRGPALEVAVGRANGDIQLLSTSNRRFGKSVQDVDATGIQGTKSSLGTSSPGNTAITWTEWNPQSHLLAACKSSKVALYDLSKRDSRTLVPIEQHDMTSPSQAEDEATFARSVKFLAKDTIVCALGGTTEPLRWAKITPSGLQFSNACHSTDRMVELGGKHWTVGKERASVQAIETIDGDENLVLSAWRDGSYRLSDYRTPSPYDTIYRDGFQPYESASSLLVYGFERFVSGSTTHPTLRFFDFRNPKAYHYSSAHACSAESPSPEPAIASNLGEPRRAEWRGYLDAEHDTGVTKSCCRWHRQMTSNAWRPDASIMFDKQGEIFSLAKACDMSKAFHVGLRGSFIDMTCTLADDVPRRKVEWKTPEGWRVDNTLTRNFGTAVLLETGVGACNTKEWEFADYALPSPIAWRGPLMGKRHRAVLNQPAKTLRLDASFIAPSETR